MWFLYRANHIVGGHCNCSPREPENLVTLLGTVPDLEPFISATLAPLTFALVMYLNHVEFSLLFFFFHCTPERKLRFEIHTTSTTNITVFSNVTQCSKVDRYQRFERICFSHLQCRRRRGARYREWGKRIGGFGRTNKRDGLIRNTGRLLLAEH